MTGSIQCVFLIDESVSFASESEQDDSNACEILRLAVLRLLCYFTSFSSNTDLVRWSYKLFDSEGYISRSSDKQALRDFCLESFEDFEAQLILKASRRRTMKVLEKKLCSTLIQTEKSRTEILRLAFHELYADYSWDIPDISSPVKPISGKMPMSCNQRNYVFVLAPFKLFEANIKPSGRDPFKWFLPKQLHQMFSNLVQLFWIDTLSNALPPNVCRLLPLSSLTADLNDSTPVLPLSSLMKVIMSPQRRHSKTSSTPPVTLNLQLNGSLIGQLSLSSFWQSQVSIEADTAQIVGSLPLSWIPGSSSLHCSTLAKPVRSPDATNLQTLLQKLSKDSRMLVLQLNCSISECKTDERLCLLRPFGTRLGILLPLTPGVSLNSLTASGRKKVCLPPPSVLEPWAVSSVHPTTSREFCHNRVETKGPSLAADAIKGLQAISSVFNNSKRRRRRNGMTSVSENKPKALSDPALVTHCSKELRRCRSASTLLDLKTPPFDGDDLPSTQKPDNSSPDVQQASVLNRLQAVYESSVNSSRALETSAEMLVEGLQVLASSQNVNVVDLPATEGILLSAKAVGDKHEGPGRLRELQLQALLHLELQQCSDVCGEGKNELSLAQKKCLQEVVVLLRTFSFLAGASELNKFLLDVIKTRYGTKLRALLEEIGEELNVPLYPDSSSEDEAATGEENPPSVCSLSSLSTLSSTSQPTNSRKMWSRSNSMLGDCSGRRQIQVPKNILVSSRVSRHSTTAKHHKKSKIVLEGKRSASKRCKSRMMDGKKELKKVCRNLFEKPRHHSLANKSKSENHILLNTPEKKGSYRKSPKRKSGTPQSKAHQKCSPRTPQQKPRVPSGGFTPNDKFPELINTPTSDNVGKRTPRNTFRPRRTCFTPDDKFPDLISTPEGKSLFKSPSRTPRSSRKQTPAPDAAIGGSPASCTRSKLGWAPSPPWRTPTSNRSCQNSPSVRKTGRKSVACIRNLSLDMENVSPAKGAPTKSPDQKERNIKNSSRWPGKSLSVSDLSFLNNSPIKQTYAGRSSARSPKCTKFNLRDTPPRAKWNQASPLKSCLRQSSSVDELHTSDVASFNQIGTPLKCNFSDIRLQVNNTPGKMVQVENTIFKTPKKSIFTPTKQLRTPRTLLCTSQDNASQNEAPLKHSLNTSPPKLSHCDIQPDNSQTRLSPEKMPVLQLVKLPDDYCQKAASKTSPILSMRWPQKKRKLSCSPLRKSEASKNSSLSPQVRFVSPPNKKQNKTKCQYSVPSTISVLHLTTSPVITGNNQL